jgi:hypothetical protein
MNEDNKKIMDLIIENPDLEIKFMVDWEVVADDSGSWLGEFYNVKKDYYYFDDEIERIFIGEKEILERLTCKDSECITVQDDFEYLKNKGDIKEAIFVYIGV